MRPVDEAALREQVSAICLALPEVTADDGHLPHRGFKVAGKNLGWFTVSEHGSGRIALVNPGKRSTITGTKCRPPS